MFCPNCGANNTNAQKFCRTCGLNLAEIFKSLLLQMPSAESADLLMRQKRIEKIGGLAFIAGANIGVFGIGAIIYSVLVKMILSGDNVTGGIIIIALTIFAVLSLIYVIYMKALKDNDRRLRRAQTIEISEGRKTAELLEEKPFEPIPSIAESTTNLLYAEQKTKKFE